MIPENQTSSTVFILLGLFSSSNISQVFSFLFIIFILTVTENVLLILLICRDTSLHSPMYFLLSHLSFMDILHVSNIFPQMIINFLSGTRTISFAGCRFQIFLYVILLGGECLLAAMSYDHYMAICHPLHYAMLMSDSVNMLLVMRSWMMGTLNFIVHTAYVLHFPFCEPRVLNHYFYEVPALLKLSCADMSHYEQGVDVSTLIFMLILFSMISVSYIKILHTVLQTKSSQAWKKSFSTCSFHMVVVIMYYGPFILHT
ncbi:Olfactory receptor 2AJ1 [Heterocephalus glaber]|uniref:Olfactory receptor 2AJ1 n=1 Tax=Heterocephalus glaber TaxID=10181 RepID=G5C7Q1_HETGA|nr:Olfactory receptor 2AJ1 [Heterocephalus glaber]